MIERNFIYLDSAFKKDKHFCTHPFFYHFILIQIKIYVQFVINIWILLKFFNIFCILKSFNANISHQLFDYTITFVNHSTRTQIQNVILYSKTDFNRSFKKILVYKIKFDSDLVWQFQLFILTWVFINSIKETHRETQIIIIHTRKSPTPHMHL